MPTTVEIPGVGLVDYPDGMSDEAIAQAAGELHRKALAAQKPAMPALHDVFVQGAGDLIGSPIPGRTPETMGLPTSPEPMSLLTPEQSSQLEGLNRVLENLGSMGDIPGALLNRVMEGASRQVATSGKSALGLRHALEIQPAIDIAQGNLPSLNPAENFARFNKSPLAKAITEGTEEQSKYYNDKFEAMGIGPDLKPIVDFVGNAAGSTLVSIAALPAGLPGLIASSIGTFAPSFEDALNKGASPNKAFAHAVISTGAEAGSEYLGGAAARTSKFLGKMPFLPDAFRKFLDVAPRDALKDAIKEAGMNVFKRLGRTSFVEGLEEVASELAQHVSAAMLYDPTQLTNTTELLTDLFKAFAGGAVSGSLFTPIEAKAAKQMLRSEVAKGIVDQWQQSVDMAKKEGALRPEDEKSIPQAVSARMWMEIGAQRGDAETIARGKAELMRALAPSKGTVTAQEIGNQTEAEVLQAAEINRSLENPATAQQMLAQATEQYGADSGIVERLRAAIERAPVINQGFGMAYGADVAKGEVPSFQRGVPQLGRSKAIVDEKQANADWHKVITNQGYTDDQYELRQGKGYRDNLTDQATDQPSDAKGNPNKEIEGYYDEATKKVVLYQGSIYGGTKRLAEVARHEKLHQAADNPEAQRKIFRFVSEQMPKELAGEVRRLVRLGYRFRDIPEEYLANLYETERWWGEPVDRLRAKLAEWFPKLAPVPPSVAGRILARTLVRSKQEVIPTDESQKEEAGLQVNPQAEGAAGTAQTEAASTTPPAEQPAAPPAAELSTAKEPANQPAPVEVAPVSAPQETPAAKEPPAPVVKESQTTEPEKPTEPVSPPAETAPKTEAAAEPPPETKPEAKAAPSVEEKKEQPATEAFAKTEPPKEGGNENKPATAKTSGRDPIQVAEEIIRADGNTSASLVQLLQSKMLIHYTQAKHLIAELERRGVIDPNRDAIVQAERDAKAKKEQADLQAELDAELGQDSGPFAPGIVESFSKGDFAKAQELADKLPEPGEDWGFKTSDVGNMSGYGSSNPSFTRELKVRSKPLWQWINETGLAPNPAPSKPKTTKKKSSKVPRLSKPEPAPVTPELPPKEQTPDAEPPAVPTPEPTPTVEPPVVAPATATPPTPVPGEAELRATEEAKGKPEASNSRGTSTAKALKVQREYLLAAVTKAIEEAPDEVPIHPDRAEMDAARAAYVEAIKYVPEQTSEQRVAQKLKADADLATRLEPLFTKYGIPSELRYGKQNPDGTMEVVATLLDVFQRETLLSAEVAKAVWRGDNGITFDVPGDGMFTVVNSKPKLKEFAEKVEKLFPKGDGAAEDPSSKPASAKPIPSAAKLKTLDDRIKIVAPFASTDVGRRVINRVAHDGGVLVGVNGRQMAIIPAGSQSNELTQHDAKTGQVVRRESNGDDLESFPNWRQLLPSQPNWRSKIAVLPALKMVRGAIKLFEATPIIDERGKKKKKVDKPTPVVSVYLDEDGNFGIRARDEKSGSFESGVTNKSQFVGSFNGEYLEDGLVAAAQMGNSEVWFASDDLLSPVNMLGSDFSYTLMPMRHGNEKNQEAPSVRTKEAIEKSEELTKQWQELTGVSNSEPKSEKPKQPTKHKNESRKKPESKFEKAVEKIGSNPVQPDQKPGTVPKGEVGGVDGSGVEAKPVLSITATRIRDSLILGKPVNPIGMSAKTEEDRHAIAGLFRNPLFETFRWFFIKKGKVVAVASLTARSADAVYVTSDDLNLSHARKIAKEVGADSYFITHNHPSGESSPSEADIRGTVKLQKEISSVDDALSQAKFLGHIVTDHTLHHIISRTGLTEEVLVDVPKDDPILGPRPWPKMVDSPKAVAEAAMAVIGTKSGLTVIFTDARLYVRSVGEIDPSADEADMIKAIREHAKASGSTQVFGYLWGGPQDVVDKVLNLVRSGLMNDAITPDFSGGISRGALRRGGITTTLHRPVGSKDAKAQIVTNKSGKLKFSIVDMPASPSVRESVLDKDEQWLRGEFPGAPNVVYRVDAEEGREDGPPIYYDGWGQIVVVTSQVPRSRAQRRGLMLAALHDAGIEKGYIKPEFWQAAWDDISKVDSALLTDTAKTLGVDIRDESGRRQVLRRLVEQRMSGPTKYGLVRTLLRMFKAEAPTARVVDRIHAEIEKLSESFIPKTPGEFNPQDPAQVFADKNAATWGLRSFIYGLRDQANQLAYQAIEASQWKRIQDRLNALADQAEAASIGSGRRRFRPDINGSMFMSELSGYGVPFTQADAAAHQTWLEEQEARRVAGLMDSLERNQEVASSLAANFPEYEAEALRATITRQESKLARIEEERPEIYHRANVIRSATEAIPAAKAARDALATPEIADWVETIYQIEQSGVTPRAFDEMGGNLRTDAETAAGMFAHSANTIHGILTERMQESSDKIVRTLRKLHAKRTELRSKQGDADVRVAELMSAIVGDAGASGGLFTREIAEQVRSRELAIGRLAVLLGNASPSTMAAQFREALSSDGEATVDAPVIRHVAADAGITEEVLRDILTLANRDTGFRNAVLMLADEADARASKRVLDVINQIEAVRGNLVGPGPQLPDGPQRAVRAGLLVAREMLGRIRLERSQASASLAEVEKAIEQAEIEQMTIRMLSDLADSAVDMSGGFMSDRIGTAEMVYRTQSNGVHLATFTKADGTTQPAVVFGSGREYTTNMVEEILAWREAALEAARDGTKNPPHVNRGLEIGAQKALEILDAYATPDKILSTAKYQPLNLWLSKQTWAIRQALPRLLPGIHGRAYAEMIAGYARLGRALDDIVAKSHSKRMRLIRSAFESMGLDQYNGIHQAEMAQAYSEIAHRLREHGSTVRVGDTLLSQRLHGTDHGTLTRELLNLIRYDRDIFREAQRVMQSEPYGGIREVLGKLRLVRPAAETGDIGLARRADKMQQRRLAEDYDAEIAVHGKDADLTGLWDKRPDMIRFHILDSTRSDLAFDRNAMIHDLEQQYARDMRSGRVPPPMTIDDTVTQLAAYAGNRIADPLNTIRKAFLGEMAVYARYAKSRTDSKGTSDRPLTGIGTWSGEDDTNEFTSPAAKLVYPSSMYHYGAETTDMRQALANVLDTSQVQVLAAGKAASTALLESVSRISEGPVGTGSMTDEDRAMVLWYNNAKTGTEVTQQMANRAMDRMRQVAAAIDADIKDIQSPTWNAPSLIHKFVGALMPFILTYPRVGISNVFGGPLSTGRILERVVGPQRAFLAMAANTAYSPLFAAYNISDWIIHKATGLNLPRSESTPQTIAWLQSIGWSSFFSHAELQAMREHTGGGGIGDAVLRGVVTAGDYLEKTVGRAVGITGTDTHLNRLAASVVVPHVLRQMQRIAIRWQNRLAEANQIAGPDAVGEFAFGTQDSQNADAIREMLRESEVHPEQFLAALANGEIDLRRFYLHPLGAKFGNAVLSDFNAATRTNRPRQRGVLNLLMGWTLYDVSRTVDLLRQPVDRSALKKFMRWSSLGAAMVIGSFYSKVISDFARRGFNEAQTAIAEHIAELLASPPGDDDDLWDWLQNILARLVASFEVHSAPKPMPWEKVWYDRPLLDIAMEVGMAVPGARGLDRLMEGGAVKTPGMGIVFQAAESSVMGVKAVAEALAGKDVEARVDSGAALRAILASFGEYGRVLGNFVVGQPRRESVATIRKAANEAGIPVTPVAMPAGSAVFRATPLRQPLLEAAVGLLDAKPEDAPAAKKRLVDVAKAVYQRAYDKVIERGGFSNPIEAKEEADKAGQRAVQSAVSSIEPVTRALGRSVTPDEYVKLKTSGALSNPEVQKETKAVAAAANYLSTIATTGGRSMVNATDSVTSPIRGGGASFGGGLSSGGGGSSRSPVGGIGIRRRRLGIARARMPRLRKPKVPKLRSVKMRKPKLPRLK